MKKILIVIVWVTFVNVIDANAKDLFYRLASATNAQEIKTMIEEAMVIPMLTIDRSVEDDYRQEVYEFDHIAASTSKTYRVNLITKNQRIVYGQVLELKARGRVKRSKTFCVAQQEIDKLVGKHNEIYRTNYDRKSFIKQLNTIIEYSFGCGDGASHQPREAKKIIRWIKKKKKKRMMKWLKMPNPEFQAYAVFGLYRLKKNGWTLSFEENRILAHVVNKNVFIQNCAGCLAGINTPLKTLIDFEEK